MFGLFLTLVAAAAVRGGQAAPAAWPPTSMQALRASVATSQRGAAACVLFLNANGTAGCSGATHTPLPLSASVPSNTSHVSRVVVVAPAGQDALTMDALRRDADAANRVGALVALPGPPPQGAWSPDEGNPQVRER